MRIKVSVANSGAHKNINIQNIKTKNNIIYFDCSRKFEDILHNETLIFHDRKGKEIFRSDNVKINYLYYQEDINVRKQKVMFLARGLYVKDLGYISQYYLEKILMKSCNSRLYKLNKPPPNPVTKEVNTKKDYSILRYLDIVRAKKFYANIYKTYRKFRYVFKYIHEKSIIYKVTSTAPT